MGVRAGGGGRLRTNKWPRMVYEAENRALLFEGGPYLIYGGFLPFRENGPAGGNPRGRALVTKGVY